MPQQTTLGNHVNRKTFPRIPLFAILILSSNAAFPSSIIVKPEIMSNTAYSYRIITISSSKTTYEADAKTTEIMKLFGLSSPIASQKNQTLVFKTITGHRLPNDATPFSSSFDSIYQKKSVNGATQSGCGSPEIDTSLKITGTLSKDSTIISSITSNNYSPEMIDTLKSAIKQIISAAKFPSEPLDVGEEFTQTSQTSITTREGLKIPLETITSYKLKQITDGLAFFVFRQLIQADRSLPKGTTSVDGFGSGMMIYDVNSKVFTTTNSSYTLSSHFKQGNLTIDTQLDTKINIKVRIQPAN